MSNLAFSSLIIFCLLLPGIIFDYRYNKGASGWSATSAITATVPRALLWGVVYGLPAHTVWIWFADVLATATPILPIDFEVVFALLLGIDMPNGTSLYGQLNDSLPISFSFYVLSQVAAAFFLGGYIADLLDGTDWSKNVALRSPSAAWHRLFAYPSDELGEPAKIDGILLSLTVTVGSVTYLYSGFLWDYFVSAQTGKLERVILRNTQRRIMSRDAGEPVPGSGEAETGEVDAKGINNDSYQTPGEFMVIECANVETFDVDYFYLRDVEGLDDELNATGSC
ncbi:MAG: hypothetical protein QNJ00_08655 [Woeseiaceae bacterium]|nr:hypothetical protein [Woeseiaceae bacterium]